jgi:hypothetical protein
MSSADLVQRKGLGSALWASMKAWMSLSKFWVERWTPRLICFSVTEPKKRSTSSIQEAAVGVKWTCQRGRLASQSRIGLVLWVA